MPLEMGSLVALVWRNGFENILKAIY